MRALRKEGLIGLRYEFVDVSINGEHKGIYALEEHFSKELVENNQRREGPILKFGEDGFWTNRSVFGHAPGMDQGYYYRSGVEVFRENRTLGDEVLGGEFLEAKRMLELYRLGELKGRQVFDVDQWASLWALADVFGVRHGLVWHGLRFYYNPITGLMEPIAFDVEAGNVINNLAIDLDPGEYEFLGLLSDREFQEAYVRKLGEYSNERWVVSFFEEVGGELGVVVRTINRDEKYTFDRGVVERNALWVRNKLNQENVVRAVVDEAGDLMVWSLSELPLEVLAVVNSSGDEMVGLNDPVVVGGASRFESRAGERIGGVGESGEIEGMRVLWRYLGMGKVREALVSPVVVSANDKRLDRSPALPHFVWFDRARNSYVIPGGKWVMDRDLVTPEGLGLIVSPGARLDLMSGAAIIVQGPLQARGGEGDVIKIGSSDGTGEGLVVLNAKKKSVLSFVEFTNLKSVSNQANNITGAVTFYQSPTLIDHCLFEGIEAEDMLNIIGAEFEITNSSFVDASSDAVDIDFGQGEIRATSFSNLTNDGLDVSGSIVEIAGVNIAGAGDKGISVGEASRVRIEHSEMVESRTGVASKDGSSVEMFSSNISGSEIGVSVYRKKSEYGPSGIALWDVELVGNQDDWLVEEKMELLVNGKEVNEKEVGVYEKYYRE